MNYLIKPFRLPELAARCRAALRVSRQHQLLARSEAGLRFDGASEIMSSSCEVSRRLADQQALRDSEERLRTTLDALEEATTLYAVKGTTLVPTLINRAARTIFGLDRDELSTLVNQGGFEVVGEDGSPIAARDLPSNVAARTGRRVERAALRFHRQGGAVTWLRVTAQPICDASGRAENGGEHCD